MLVKCSPSAAALSCLGLFSVVCVSIDGPVSLLAPIYMHWTAVHRLQRCEVFRATVLSSWRMVGMQGGVEVAF